MDNWIGWVTETDRKWLEEYVARGLTFALVDTLPEKGPLNRHKIKVHLNGALIAQSDSVNPEHPEQEVPGQVRQVLVRVKTFLRQHPSE